MLAYLKVSISWYLVMLAYLEYKLVFGDKGLP